MLSPEHGLPVGARTSDASESAACDLAADDERAAGWFDGHRAGRAQTFNEISENLEPVGLALQIDGSLVASTGAAARFVVPEPDLEGGAEYAEGFECGFSAARCHLVSLVREGLTYQGLFLTDGLRVLSHAQTSDCVDGIHLSTEADRSGMPPEPPVREGVMRMVIRNFTRRAAIIAFGSTVLAGSLGWIGAMHMARPVPPPPPPPTWIAPTTWDLSNPVVKQLLLSIDQSAWNLEQTEGLPSATVVAQMTASFAATGPTAELTRQLYCRWLGEQDRPQYVTALLNNLSPALQDPEGRRGILRAISAMHNSVPATVITPAHRQMLQNYMASGAEDDEYTWALLDIVINDLVASGI